MLAWWVFFLLVFPSLTRLPHGIESALRWIMAGTSTCVLDDARTKSSAPRRDRLGKKLAPPRGSLMNSTPVSVKNELIKFVIYINNNDLHRLPHVGAPSHTQSQPFTRSRDLPPSTAMTCPEIQSA